LVSATKKVSEEFSQNEFKTQIISAVLKDDLIFCCCTNGSKLLLVKNNSIKVLLDSLQSPVSGSGRIKPNTCYILCTSEFYQALTNDQILSSLKKGPDEAKEELIRLLHTNSPSGHEGAIIISPPSASTNTLPPDTPSASKTTFSPKKFAVRSIDKLLSLLPERQLKLSSQTIDAQTKSQKRKITFIGIFLLILLLLSIVFGLSQKKRKEEKALYEPILKSAIHDYDEALSLKTIDAQKARDLALGASQKAKQLKVDQIDDPRLEKLLEDLSQNLGEITGIYEIETQKFLDLSLITSNFSATHMALSGETILVLDSNQKKLAGVNLATKKTNIISGPDFFQDTLSVTGHEERSFILSSDGIRETTSEVELQIKPDDWDPKNIIITSFAANMYVLEKDTNGIIWRYPGIRLGFSEKQNWFGAGVSPDFSKAVSMAIDGSIWVLTSSGNILKYTQGSPKAFSLPNTLTLNSPIQIFTNENTSSLYILSPSTKNITVISKEGDYQAQYTNEVISQAKAIVVSEEQKKLIFLTGEKLLSIELKHIK
jgi:hypothetical protein